MDKKVTTAELAEFAKKGTVKFDPEDTNIARFGELIEKLTTLLEQNAARTQADLARSQVQLEILGALQKSINSQKRGVIGSHSVDLSPLREVLEELKLHRSRCSFQFDIQRGEGGYMAGVTATPVPQTQH